MKNMKKVLAALLALTMTVCLASCGETGGNDNAGSTAENSKVEDSKTEEKEESKAEEKEEESKTEETEAAVTEAAAADSGYKEFEHRTLKHEPYTISADYDLPVLDDLTIKDGSEGITYFSTMVKCSSYYRKEGDNLGVDVYSNLELITKDRAKEAYERDGFTVVTSDNGYNISYQDFDVYNPDTEKSQWQARLVVYGESYRECSPILSLHFLADQKKMTEDEFEKYVFAVANSVKLTVENEDALILDDGSCKVYPHKIIVPSKVSIAGADCEAKLIFSQIYPEAFVEFAADGINYEMNTDILSENSLKWEKTKEKSDEYTAVKVAGHDALAKLATYGLNGEFVIQLSEDHVETVNVSGKSYDDGSMKKDGKSFYDLQKEMIDDANQADTIAKMAEYVDAFVSSWTIDETVQAPK